MSLAMFLWGLAAWSILTFTAAFVYLTILVWLDIRAAKRVIADYGARIAADAAFARTEPVAIIEAAEQIVKEAAS